MTQKTMNLTYPENRILKFLVESEGIYAMSDIARTLNIAAGIVRSQLRQMGKMEVVDIYPPQHGRKSKHVKITKKGKKLFKRGGFR